MLPLMLFAKPVIAASMIGNLLIGVMLYAMDSYMPLFMQAVRGGDANSASTVLTPLILCWSLSAFIGAKALVRFGFQRVALFGVLCMVLSSIALTMLRPGTPKASIIGIMAILGSGLGPASMAFLVSAQSAVGWRQRGVVTASSQFFRSIGGTLGVGVLGAALNGRMTARLTSDHLHTINPNALLNSVARSTLSAEALRASRVALESGLHLVFLLLCGAAMVGLIALIRIGRRPAGVDVCNDDPREVREGVAPVGEEEPIPVFVLE